MNKETKVFKMKRICGDGNKVIRRTITVDDEVNSTLNKIRASLLSEKNVEVDFTSAINGFARLGIEHLVNGQLTTRENEIISRYIFGYPELKEEAALHLKSLLRTTLGAKPQCGQLK